jgi:hypothetical protein
VRRTAIAVFLLAVFASTVAAQGYDVRAFTQPGSRIVVGQPFQLVIQAEGEANPQVIPPAITGLDNLRVVSGPNTSSRFSWSNRGATSTYQLIYTLVAERPGTAKIPAIEVEVDSKKYTTSEIELEVRQAPSGPSRRVQPQQGQQRQQREPAGGDTHDVYIVAELGADEVWVGQPVPLTVTLLTTERISNVIWRSEPSFSTSWVETLDVNPDAERYRTTFEGRQYTAYPIVRKLLIPPGSGEFEFEPYVAQIIVRESGEDVFDLFSFGRSETISRRTEKLSLTVRQLPQGQPQGFGGAVGSYDLSASLDRQRAVVNDAVALKATVEGEGVLTSVEPPIFAAPSDLKVFEPRVVESRRNLAGKMISKKSWEWILVPLTPGEIRIPELRFPYFNAATSSYEVASSDGLVLEVEKGDGGDAPAAARADIQLQRRELAFIKPLMGRLTEMHGRTHHKPIFIFLACLPVAVVPFVIILGRRHARLRQDVGLARSRKARSRARRRLRAAGRKLEHADSAAFHEDVARTLVDYVADRFNRAAAGLTYDLAEELLSGRGIDPKLIRRYRSCLESCDFARYVPAASKSERRAETLEEASAVVDALEKAW